MSDYFDFLQGKTVALVGPAKTMVGSAQGPSIDQYDVVIRTNKALPIPDRLKADIGTRTDVLYNCLNQGEDAGGPIKLDLWKNELEWLCSPYPKYSYFQSGVERFEKVNKGLVKFNVFDLEEYLSFEKQLGCRPNTGVLAIHELLRSPLRQLYITGFTFFKGGYYSEYRDYTEAKVLGLIKAAGFHKVEPQLEWFSQAVKNNSRLVLGQDTEQAIL